MVLRLNPQSLHLWLVRLPVVLRWEVLRIRLPEPAVGLEGLEMGVAQVGELVKVWARRPVETKEWLIKEEPLVVVPFS